jgi:hypothetical protein
MQLEEVGCLTLPSIPRENIDAEAASTDGRATLHANGQTHMFERKVVIKNHGGV